jgi:hypothetical protein
MAAYKIGLLPIYGTKEPKEKITCKELGQQRCFSINEILSTLAPLQFCGCQIKQILMCKHLNLSGC